MENTYVNQKEFYLTYEHRIDIQWSLHIKSIVNYLKHGNYICKSEGILPDIRKSY